jgi:hypothetical protein
MSRLKGLVKIPYQQKSLLLGGGLHFLDLQRQLARQA